MKSIILVNIARKPVQIPYGTFKPYKLISKLTEIEAIAALADACFQLSPISTTGTKAAAKVPI